MADGDILERLDATLTENSRVIAENQQAFADLRVFTRDLVGRQERFMQGVMRELAEFRADLGEAIRDLTDEIHSHRDALFQVLDHIQPEEGPAGA